MKSLILVFALIIVYAVMICVVTEGICISEYPDVTSTRFTRRFDANPCPEGIPCHVYLTYPGSQGIYHLLIVRKHEKLYHCQFSNC